MIEIKRKLTGNNRRDYCCLKTRHNPLPFRLIPPNPSVSSSLSLSPLFSRRYFSLPAQHRKQLLFTTSHPFPLSSAVLSFCQNSCFAYTFVFDFISLSMFGLTSVTSSLGRLLFTCKIRFLLESQQIKPQLFAADSIRSRLRTPFVHSLFSDFRFSDGYIGPPFRLQVQASRSEVVGRHFAFRRTI
jgi:hypothetical protein